MNNEIIENNNNLQDNNENQNNSNFYKINIIKTNENEVVPQTPVNNKQNRLLLSPTVKRRKSKNEDEINKMMLDSSFREKKIPLSKSVKKENPPDSPKSPRSPNFIQNLKKTKTLKEKNKNSVRYNNKKDKNKDKDKEILYQYSNISPKRRISVNYNNNYFFNNSNKKTKKESSYLNILKYTKKLYENDEHLNKQMLTKKIDINDLSKIKKSDLFISNKMNNKHFQKKKLIISFGLNENENPILFQESYNKNLKSFKRKISSATRGKPSNELSKNKEKSSFSNFLQFKQKSQNRENEDETSKHFYGNNYYNFDNNLIEENSNKNYKPNKDGDITSKSSKFYLRAKTFKTKNLSTGKILEEKTEKDDKNGKNKNKLKINQKANKIKNQKKESIISNKNKINDFDILKKESPKNIENKIENSTNKKKKKFWFFCCFGSKENESEEI